MRKHPIVEFVKYVLLITLLILTENPLSIGIIFLFITIITKGRFWLLNLWVIVAIIFIDSFASLDGVTYLCYHNYHIITLEAVLFGLTSGVKMSALVGICWKFSQDVKSDKLVVVTSYLSPNLALLISMTVRNIDRYSKKLKEIYSLRIASNEDSNIISKFYEIIVSVSILLDWALENGMETTFSMLVRKYGTTKRSSYKSILISRRDIVEVILQILVFIAYIISLPNVDFFPEVKIGFSIFNICILTVSIFYCSLEEYFESQVRRDQI